MTGGTAQVGTWRIAAVLGMVAGLAVSPQVAAASPVSGPHETLDSRLSTEQPNAPTGFSFRGVYHARGNPHGPPPYMRRMLSLSASQRYDTSVPPVCSASDNELATQGPAACPPGSRLGGGTSVTAFMAMFPNTVQVTVFNGQDQQIMLSQSPVFATVTRGRIHPNGSVEYAAPTCFPSSPLVSQCPVDDVLQLESSIAVAPYTRMVNGRLRSYLTTPPICPPTGRWTTPIRFWWADGSVDTVLTKQPCRRPRPHRRAGSKSRRHHRHR